MNLTPNQRASIEQPGNVLVLAGAGSGKTSTLVERCLHHLLHPTTPAGIDEMLVVTFTDAAAAEVRHRLADRLTTARHMAASPVSGHLERQLALLESAHVSTLHSFCLHLIRQHFHELALDPSSVVFRDEQARLFMEQSLDSLFERHFDGVGAESKRVQALVESYGAGNEDRIRSLVLKLHNYGQTLANPAQWFAAHIARTRDPVPKLWRQWLAEALSHWCDEWGSTLQALTDNKFAAQFCSRVKAARIADMPELSALLADVVQAVNPVPRGFASDRDAIQDFFDEATFLHSLLGRDAAPSVSAADPLTEDWSWTRSHMETLLLLSQEFGSAYAALKREHAALDFHDLEQFALDLLLGPKRAGRTGIAAHWQQKFKLIFVDEYQDINAAQDSILRALAREGADANRFMVGDVKQSIYRFRLADPSIFQNYKSGWQADPARGRVIPLQENFRSAAPILDFVNTFFASLMHQEVGGVEYDSDAHLHPAKTDRPHPTDPCVEIHLRLAEKQNGSNGDPEDEENATAVELEARLVANRLRELHDSQHLIWDPATKKPRVANWSDMAVLLRSPAARAEIYAKEFTRAGIPLQAERGGLFDNTEVTDLLSLLELLDNPLQDVPLLAVLRSPLVGLSLDELAHIRARHRNGLFWGALQRWHDFNRNASTEPQPTWQKVDVFLERFARWRKMARHSPLSHRIEAVVNETGYSDWLLTQSRPVQRQANVRRFLSLAGQFDPMQRQGLQRFLRFIQAQRNAEVDNQPEALEDTNAVRLLSIHRSKGLEFPVVAVAGLGVAMNFRDLYESVLLDEHYGLCPHIRPPGCGSSYPSLAHWLGGRRQRRERIGEEARLLYVALTRARDTLLLFGSVNRKTAEEKWAGGPLTLRQIEKSQRPLDWLGPWCSEIIGRADWCSDRQGVTRLFRWQTYDDSELMGSSLKRSEPLRPRLEAEPATLSDLAQRLEWRYPWLATTRQAAKLSVTALRQTGEDDNSELRFRHRTFRKPKRQRTELSAAEIGIAHHLFLQNVDLQRVDTLNQLRAQAIAMEHFLAPEQVQSLDLPALADFWNSSLGRRILQHRNAVHREVPFTARFTAADLAGAGVSASIPEGEFVVVQGAIDLAVVLPKELWIVDFKTDVLAADQLSQAIENYTPQLRLYASALSRIYRRPVSALYVHFLSLSRSVEITTSQHA